MPVVAEALQAKVEAELLAVSVISEVLCDEQIS